MTWLLAVAVPAVVIGSGGTVLLRGDGPALKALCRGALARLARQARRVPLLAPHKGHHVTPAPAPARVPAPEVRREQATPRPADPPAGSGAVRAGATMTPGAVNADSGTRQAPASLTPDAAPPRGAAAAPDPAPPSAGPGQRPQGQPVYWHRGDGSVVVIGYGPMAEIPRPSVNLRVTGAHVVVPDAAPLVSRRYSAFEARRDKAVNL